MKTLLNYSVRLRDDVIDHDEVIMPDDVMARDAFDDLDIVCLLNVA
jgi:hypothetical protein